MSDWISLARELDAWSAQGRSAGLWWRDDDATAPTPALERLLEIRRRHGLGIALAVIPARAVPALADRLAREHDVVAWQHGWAHMNHAPVGQPKAEIGPHRPAALIMGELSRGWLALDRIFGPGAWSPVLVPPHNRIGATLAGALADAGYRGLSAGLGPRPADATRIVNAHVDIMNWTTRGFAGEAAALAALVTALAAHRTGPADPTEPVGFLTHHLAHDEAAWRFTDAALGRLKAHPAVRFVHPLGLFP